MESTPVDAVPPGVTSCCRCKCETQRQKNRRGNAERRQLPAQAPRSRRRFLPPEFLQQQSFQSRRRLQFRGLLDNLRNEKSSASTSVSSVAQALQASA